MRKITKDFNRLAQGLQEIRNVVNNPDKSFSLEEKLEIIDEIAFDAMLEPMQTKKKSKQPELNFGD